MDERQEQVIRQAASLAYHLAALENAWRVTEQLQAFQFFGETLRWHIEQAETIAADDLARCRRIIRGDYSR
jgi:hypothetical protein